MLKIFNQLKLFSLETSWNLNCHLISSLYSVQCTVYSLQSTVYTVQYTLYSVLLKLVKWGFVETITDTSFTFWTRPLAGRLLQHQESSAD